MSDSNSYGSSVGAQHPQDSSLFSQPSGPGSAAAQPNPDPSYTQPSYTQPSYPQQPSYQQPSYPQYGADPQNGAQPGQVYGQPGQVYGQPYAQDPSQQVAAPYGQPGVPYVQPGAAPYGQPVATGERKWSGLAIAGVVIALVVLIIGLFSKISVVSILPIALCVRALIDINRTHKKGKVLAIIGLVLAGLGVIVYIINVVGS